MRAWMVSAVLMVAGLASLPVARAAQAVPSDAQLQAIIQYDFGQSRAALAAVDDEIRAAEPASYGAVEARLVVVLQDPAATYAGRKFVCETLSRIGSSRCVPVLAGMLTDGQTAHLARFALQRLPCPEAGAALREALGKVGGPLKVGVISSIGERGDREAVPQLAALVGSPDAAVAGAAIAALGRIGGTQAADALASATVPEELRPAWTDARLSCGYSLLKDKQGPAAAGVFRDLYAQERGDLQRAAALRGIVLAEREKAAPFLLDVLQNGGPALQRTAAALAVDVPGSDMTLAFAGRLSALPAQAQVALLGALSDRGDPAAAPGVEQAAASDDPQVRVAALQALGAVGTAESVGVLARAAAGPGPAARAASDSLLRLRADGVDAAIQTLVRSGAEDVRPALIRALAARGTPGSVPLLLSSAAGADAATRTEALKALGELADEKDLPALVQLLVRSDDGTRSAAERAVGAVCDRIEDRGRRAEPLLAALPAATSEAKCSLVRVLGHLGGEDALGAATAALDQGDEALRDAAVRALSGWPDAAAAPALLELARNAPSPVHRTLALRGYIRVAGLPSSRPAPQTVQMYRAAMEAAGQPQERAAVLAGAARVPDLSALQFVRGYLDDPALKAEAQLACVQLALAVSGAHEAEARDALRSAQAEPARPDIGQRASEALAALERHGDYIICWQVSGPYYREGQGPQALFDTAFPPEQGEGAGAAWRLVPGLTDPAQPWLVDLEQLVGGENCVAYLRTEVYSPSAQKALLEVGSDDGVKAWLNGKLVHQNNALRGLVRDQDRVEVMLDEGWNPLLLKVTQGGVQWSACARLRTPQDRPLDGLKFRTP